MVDNAQAPDRWLDAVRDLEIHQRRRSELLRREIRCTTPHPQNDREKLRQGLRRRALSSTGRLPADCHLTAMDAAARDVIPVIAQTAIAQTAQPAASNDAESCPICMDGAKNHALIPCGHTYCGTCCAQFERCPICRTDVSSRLKIFV